MKSSAKTFMPLKLSKKFATKRLRVQLLLLGTMKSQVQLEKIFSATSELFEIVEAYQIESLPDPDQETGFLNLVFGRSQLGELTRNEFEGLTFALIDYDLENNFYMLRVSPHAAVLSVRNPSYFLEGGRISIENFILRNIYAAVTVYRECGDRFSEEAEFFTHREFRKCLFDLNGDLRDIVLNTEEVGLCDACRTRIREKALPSKFLPQLLKELKKIHKPLVDRIELFFHRHLLISLFGSFAFAVLIGILSNYLFWWIAPKSH